MIVVLGRPAVREEAGPVPSGRAARIALGAARAGARVEMVGSIGDDATGDAVAVALARAGVGHAALLRIPGAATPREGHGDPSPRLEAADVELGLRYLPEVRVLVAAEPLDGPTEAVVLEAARYHDAALVAVVEKGPPDAALAAAATVLAAPGTPDGSAAFDEVVGRYAAGLEAGLEAGAAFAAATQAVGWQPAG